jgi:hypothetical protein
MPSTWPSLPYEAWRDTASTLQLWLQIVGKVTLARSPWINHSWHVAFQVTARGLSTRLLEDGGNAFQIEFDFIQHALIIRVADGRTITLPLRPQSTAAFYESVMNALASLNLAV